MSGISVRIQHGFGELITGYEIRLRLQSNFQIHIDRTAPQKTSYIWRAKQQENALIQIEYDEYPFPFSLFLLSSDIQLNPFSAMKNFDSNRIPHRQRKISVISFHISIQNYVYH